ncbi:MAG: DUF2950 family protein, partial [Planctomycetota bacterium]
QRLVIVLDIGNRQETIETLLSNLFEESADASEYQKATIYSYERADFHYTYLDTKFLFSPEKETVELMVRHYQTPPQKSLAASPLFQKAKTNVSAKNNEPMFFVNLEQIFAACEEEIPPEANIVLEDCGLKSIKTISASFNVQDNGLSKTQVYLDLPANQRKGLTKLFDETKPCQLWLDLVPTDVLSYNAVSIDLNQVWTEIENMIRSMPFASDMEEEIVQKLGFSLKDDLFPSLGTNFVSYSTLPEPGGLNPLQVTIVKLKDKEKFESCITKLAKQADSTLQKISFKNHEIKGGLNQIDIMMGRKDERPPDELMNIPFFQSLLNTKYYYFILSSGGNDYLYWANNLDILKKIIEQLDKKSETLADDQNFKKAPVSFTTNSQYVLYVNEKQMYTLTVNYLRQMVNSFLPLVMGFSREPKVQEILDTVSTIINQLPSGQTIGKHLSGTYLTVKTDKQGVKIESVSSVGLEASVPAIAIVAAIAIPNLLSSRQSANEISAIYGLRTLISTEAVWMQQDSDRNGVKDYWTYDVSCFYRMLRADGATKVQMIDIAFAKADAVPAPDGVLGTEPTIENFAGNNIKPTPKSGYFFKAMKLNSRGNPYNQETVGNNVAATNQTEFAFAAYPAEYGKSGRRTFIVNEGGTIYAKDLGPNFGIKEEPKPAPELTPELAKEIQKLIENLGDKSFEVRDQATQELIEINQTGLNYLKEALKDDDAEIRFRANLIIKKITEPPLLPIDQWPAGDPTTAGWSVSDY